jgi:hypothetical protein
MTHFSREVEMGEGKSARSLSETSEFMYCNYD